MIKNIYLLTLCFFVSHAAFSQSLRTEEEKVLQVIMQLFEGMKQGDSAMISPLFDAGARLMTTYEQEGQSQLVETPIKAFISAVGSPHEEVWNETIQHPVVQVDQTLASVWAPYRFMLGNSFSHCGVNAFQLVKKMEGWKIIQITDTRRQDDCP